MTEAAGEHDDPNGVGPTINETRMRLRSPLGALIIVGAAYAILQLLLLDPTRFLEWDEAVLIGEATGRYVNPQWTAQRASGVPWLIAPAFWVSGSFVWMRIYLIVVSSVFTTAAFAVWRRPAGWAAPIGMLVFCTTWTTIFYGSEASPNLYIALCGVAGAGAVVVARQDRGRGPLWIVGIASCAAVIVRPTDGLVLGAFFAASSVVISRRPWNALASIAGAALGLLPWIIDAYVRFGGPIDRWRVASNTIESGLGWRVDDHLRLLDGPLLGPDSGGYDMSSVLVVAAVLVLALLGVIMSRHRSEAAVALAGAGAMAAPYLLYVGSTAPRFLLPALALMAIAAGYGATAMVGWRRYTMPALVVLFVFVAGSGLATARSIGQSQTETREVSKDAASVVGELAGTRSCSVLAQYSYPQIMVASGCLGMRLDLARAACQAKGVDGYDAVIVSVTGELPLEISTAVIGPPRRTESGWTIGELDLAQLDC